MIPFPARALPAALDYAARGWPVLPLEPGGKKPFGRLVRNGLRGASTDPETIKAWWSAEPDANVGTVCGPSSFDVLDVDGPEGESSLAALEKKYGKLPETRMHSTGRGRHILFLPSGIPCSAGKVGPGLDTKGSGDGYVVMPPSVHASGKVYAPFPLPLVAAPSWLVRLARARGPKATGRTLAESVALVSDAPEGERNSTLNRETFIRSKDADSPDEAEAARGALQRAAESAGLSPAESRRASTNGHRAGRTAAARTHTRYKRVPEMLFKDKRYRGRTPHAKLLALIICSGPQAMTIPGVALMTRAQLAEEAGLSKKGTEDAVRELTFARLLRSDARSGVYWLPSVTAIFSPNSTAQERAWRNVLDGLPDCALTDDIAAAVRPQFRTENPRSPKRALKNLGVKEERSPLCPPTSPNEDSHERKNERAEGVA